MAADDLAIIASWRRAAKDLGDAQVRYAQAFLRAKIRKDVSDGMAHQIAIEETAAATTYLQAELDIVKARWYGRKENP
jgi:hypothetical protein